jgi:acyl-CoA synthetase (AMP-forming)/AMP-acid ligase II/acyl carrier protein
MQQYEKNITAYLKEYAAKYPGKAAFISLTDGECMEIAMSYGQLEANVALCAGYLSSLQLSGKRVLLVYQDILEFIVTFLACQQAGVIAIPVPYIKKGRQLQKIVSIINDAGVETILTTADTVSQLQEELTPLFVPYKLTIAATNKNICGSRLDAEETQIQQIQSGISFIQYTSGSTGTPKGVVISNANLIHNQQMIQDAFGCNENSVIFSWLPFHHDMGLIGNILHTIFAGCTAVLMSPFHFAQRPQRWLEAITKYKVTHSGGPNFAYDICADKIKPSELEKLDLSSWTVAYNGSEAVRYATLQRFYETFKTAGFAYKSFFPCYGLAEATLLVSGSKDDNAPLSVFIDKRSAGSGKIRLTQQPDIYSRPVVSSGIVSGSMSLKIISVQDGHECVELEEGKIFIAGKNVTAGYWNKPTEGVFSEIGGVPYLDTGDLAFFYQGRLFVHGRLKEMLIIRGRNFYPYDIEEAVAASHPSIEDNGVAVCSINEGDEDIVIIAEIKRTALKNLDKALVINTVERTVIAAFGFIPYDVLLVEPLKIPRTTSGKLQRVQCRHRYNDNDFEIIASKQAIASPGIQEGAKQLFLAELIQNASADAVKRYLVHVIEAKAGTLPVDFSSGKTILTEIGIDSLRAMELVNTINMDLGINMDAAGIFHDNTLEALAAAIENMLWLKNSSCYGKEITI